MIELADLCKSFGTKHVLSNVDLQVGKGETVVVIGRSGTGKSVLLKHVLGLMKPDSGTVSVFGQPLHELDRESLYQLRRRCGVLFQGGALFDSMTIAQNIALGLSDSRALPANEISRVVRERLDWVGLPDSGDKFPSELSGGMRKRAALARALAMNPEIVLYDEPTTGLDPVTAEGINDLIVHLKERLHVTAIAVTHDMRSAFKIADRIAMLHEGRIIFEGTVAQTQQSDNPIVRQFIQGNTEGPLTTY